MNGVSGVNHVAAIARDMDETARFYREALGVPIRKVVNDEPGSRHYSFDLGGEGTLDFFEAPAGAEGTPRDTVGALNHLAITATPEFIAEAESRLAALGVETRSAEREGQRTIYFHDPNGIDLQLYPSTGGSRA